MKEFKKILSKLFKERHAQSVPLSDFTDYLTSQKLTEPFTPEEVNAALDIMSNANQVMVSNDIVFLI